MATGYRYRQAQAAAIAQDAIAWTRALSLTSALLSQMAASPETRRRVSDLLAAEAEQLSSPVPFDETMTGLQTRELREPAVFSRFFGGRAAA